MGEELDIGEEVLAETASKAALVRLATMTICGLTPDSETVTRYMRRGLFNQLGDDLWDIYEDFDADRVTPFTLFLTGKTRINPFDLYFDIAATVVSNESRRRQDAALLGYLESFRDCFVATRLRDGDPLCVLQHLHRALEQFGDSSPRLCDEVPHVDLDAILFAAEDLALSAR